MSSTSFTFNKFEFNNEKDLIFQGDASISKNNVLNLTKVDQNGLPLGTSVGRVLYSAPIHLFSSSALASSFETTFTFRISSNNSNNVGDGLAFFIAAPETTIPPGSNGRLLGLFSGPYTTDKVVAVEFDTYPNRDIGDPDFTHIGIDINTLKSSAVGKWSVQSGAIATAYISYDSVSKILSVISSYPNAAPVTVTHAFDLDKTLPEWVRVGFSASTGLFSQKNDILSWSFRSTLTTNNIV
ncbi:lectin alpha chain [Arachis duranensis]|uniref:Lectin alpha chain n=1 Tax=Arachis duranensis TaxID=130453 RepID=A0A6P4AY17_ARADU|nr:lectin alpha chain [Arachis duranensis]